MKGRDRSRLDEQRIRLVGRVEDAKGIEASGYSWRLRQAYLSQNTHSAAFTKRGWKGDAFWPKDQLLEAPCTIRESSPQKRDKVVKTYQIPSEMSYIHHNPCLSSHVYANGTITTRKRQVLIICRRLCLAPTQVSSPLPGSSLISSY